ncbi:MAG: hypothetical protein J6Y94_01495, partial [Bacteriovoracaceae bacterium]|nr:hypothetical protein [Bacteriovoracaceae bacterium]
MKAMMLILLLASMAGGNHARAAADEAASSAHAGQHPLNTISQKFQKQFADTDSWDTPQRTAIIQNYLQEVAAYFKAAGIAYKAQERASEDMFLEVLPGQDNIFNRMAADLARDGFTMHFDGLRNLESPGHTGEKMLTTDLAAGVAHLGDWFIPYHDQFTFSQLKFRSPVYMSEREIIQHYRHKLTPFLFSNGFYALGDTQDDVFAQDLVTFPDGLPTLDRARLIFLPNTELFTSSALKLQRKA